MENRKSRAVKAAVIAALLLSASLAPACSCRNSSAVIIAGSTSVQPYAEILAEEYEILHRGGESEIDVLGGGSSAGITAVESGAADIGMSSRALKGDELGLWSAIIALDGLAIIVHPDNPVGDLTFDQLRGIYTASITNWSELGGPDARIHVITREEGSGTRSAFEDLVMDESMITPRAIVQDSNGAVRQVVSGDRNSIGFISFGLADETVKTVCLEGSEITWENVADGSYSLYRPFLFVCADEPTGKAKEFIDFTLSAEGQRLLINEGLIPPTERAGK